MPRSPQEIYARHLLSQRGYPLWTPEPSREFLAYRRDGLRIGDVGVIIPEDGCFDVYFNLCLPHDHSFHRAKGVPDNFRPVELDDTDFRTVTNAEKPRCIIATSSVKRVRMGERSGDSPSTRSGTRSSGLEYEFSFSSSEGALLILPEGAERCDLRNHHRFLEAATQQGADWYRFAEEKIGQIIGNDSLYLITGLYKTCCWSLAAFEKTVGSAEYPAQLRLPQVGGGDPVATCTWDTTRALDCRAGPVDNYGLPNQTVFIRGFKIAHRTGIFRTRWITVEAGTPSTRPNLVKSVGAVPGDSWLAYMFGGPSTGRTAESSNSGVRDEVVVDPALDAARNEIQNNGALAVGEDVVIHRMPEASQAFHPSDIINSYLLDKEPSANIAVTHDDEWITLLEKNLLRPEDLAQAGLLETLISQNYDVFSEAGAVYLRSRYKDPGISSATEVQDSISIRMPSPTDDVTTGQTTLPTGTFNQHHSSSPSHVPDAPRLRSFSLSEESLPDIYLPPSPSMIDSGAYNATGAQMDSRIGPLSRYYTSLRQQVRASSSKHKSVKQIRPASVAKNISEKIVRTVARGSRELGESRATPNDTANVQEGDDIVIAVMGRTGSGKSTFVSLASGQGICGIGHELKSCTDKVTAVKFWDHASGRHAVLVDTPGFDDASTSDFDVLTMISEWLASSYREGKLLSGILYLHRITDNRMVRTSLMNLKVFQKLCGKDALDTVHLTTTMWDEVDESVGKARLKELETDYWKWMIDHGAQTARCRHDNDSAKDLVRQIILAELHRNEVTQAEIPKHQSPIEAMAVHAEEIRNLHRKVLQIQEEMVDRKMELKDTAAGQELCSQLDALAERQTAMLRRLEDGIGTKGAIPKDILADLQRERDALQAKFHDLMCQMEVLRLPWFKRLLHRK